MILPLDLRLVLSVCGLLVLLAPVRPGHVAAHAGGAASQEFVTRTELVEVYATVTDAKGRFVTDLARDEFVVLEDGVPQTVTTFADGEQPVSIALAVDRSWSMADGRLAAAQRGGRELLLELGDQDRTMLVAIGSDVEVAVALTNNRLAVDTALQGLDPWGSTALRDAVVTAFDAIEPAPGRRALVLVSDGLERNSRLSAEDVLARAGERRAGVSTGPAAQDPGSVAGVGRRDRRTHRARQAVARSPRGDAPDRDRAAASVSARLSAAARGAGGRVPPDRGACHAHQAPGARTNGVFLPLRSAGYPTANVKMPSRMTRWDCPRSRSRLRLTQECCQNERVLSFSPGYV